MVTEAGPAGGDAGCVRAIAAGRGRARWRRTGRVLGAAKARLQVPHGGHALHGRVVVGTELPEGEVELHASRSVVSATSNGRVARRQARTDGDRHHRGTQHRQKPEREAARKAILSTSRVAWR